MGRSPVRIDVAGGWTDTPPYSLYSGGSVVNLAIELNGQPPLQVYVKPCHEFHIVLRSIDMGAVEVIRSYEELQDYKKVGSPFSIPKAALTLAGFAPLFAAESHASLEEHLKAFGSGLEITLLVAIPAGSGLGTSSILASTVLGAINDFCGLAWIGTTSAIIHWYWNNYLPPAADGRINTAAYSRRKTVAIRIRLRTTSISTVVTRPALCAAGISGLPSALLYRNHPYSQRHLS